MAEWKKLAFLDECANLSTETPLDIGTTAAQGTGSAASKDDHVHELGTGCVDDTTLVLTASVADVKDLGVTYEKLGASLVRAEYGVAETTGQFGVDYGGAIGIVSNELGIVDDGIKAVHIDKTANAVTFANFLLTPKATGGGTTVGSLFYDSDDDHLYGYIT